MDVSRNHLVADINSVPAEDRSRYSRVPNELLAEALTELGGKPDVYVNPNRETALAKWAAKKRKKQRAKNKIAKAARARNRAV